MSKSILASLKLTEKPITHQTDPVMIRRSKMLTRLQEQREAALAMLDGKVFEVFKEKIIDKEGEKIKIKVPKRVKTWFFSHNKAWHLEVRYGNVPMELAAGKAAIEVGEVTKLVPTIDTVIAAVHAGELDELLKRFTKDTAE